MFKPMLAEPIKDRQLTGPWIHEPKFDGIRALWDGAQLRTRPSDRCPNGNPISNPPALLNFLRSNFAAYHFDGELFSTDWNVTASVVRAQSFRDGEVVYHVFDMPLACGKNLCGRTLDQRKDQLDDALLGVPPELLQPVTWRPIGGRTAEQLAKEYIAQGFEGAMLKQLNSPYLPTSSAFWLKVKFDKEIDCIITGAELGEGRNASTLGALYVEGIGDDRQLWAFKVGGGFTDRQRAELWRMHQEGRLAGLPMTATYQPDPKGKIKARFPRFVRLREFEL